MPFERPPTRARIPARVVFVFAALALLAGPALAPTGAHAQSDAAAPTPSPHAGAPSSAAERSAAARRRLADWDQTAQAVERALAAPNPISAIALDRLRGTLTAQRFAARELSLRLEEELGPLEAQLGALGAPEDAPDDPEFAARRDALTARVADLSARKREIDLAETRAGALETRLAQRQRAQVADALLSRGPSVFEAETWRVAAQDAPRQIGRLIAGASAALSAARPFGAHAPAMLALLAALLLIGVARRRLRRLADRLARDDLGGADAEAGLRRIGVRGAEFALRAGPVALSALLLAAALEESAGLTTLQSVLVARAAEAAAVIAGAAAFAFMALRAHPPERRLLQAPPPRGRIAANALTALAAIAAARRALADVGQAAGAAPETLALISSLAALIAAPLLLTLAHQIRKSRAAAAPEDATQAAIEQEAEPGEPEDRIDWRGGGSLLAKGALAAAALAVACAAALGYAPLAVHVLEGAALTIVIAALVAVAFAALSGVVAPARAEAAGGQETGAPRRRDGAGALLRLAIGALLLTTAAPAIALVWGVSETDIAAVAGALVGGVTIGGANYSVLDVLGALAALIIGLWLTRLAQRVLRRVVLPNTRLDAGARNAVAAGVGYAGFFLTALLAVGAAGLDLSNLAIIAGALSVGIGFGLQNIVNNFVSGVILLVERPIKIGDWIEVAGASGYVKKINVRSTEIETFERASVIVPNSELIAAAVTNWTHTSLSGRATVPVGVGYDSDVDEVARILREAAAAHPMVQRYPQPWANFANFGDSALEFELRCYVRDVNSRLSVESDLRGEILKRLRAAGVDIPFPQRVVTVAGGGGAAALEG